MATIVNVQDPSTSNNLAVDSSGRIGVNNWPAVQTIQGTVNVALFPSVQPVSGAVDVTDRSLRQLGIVTVANGGIGTNTAPAYTIIQDPTSNAHKMAINADGSINISGSITASNPSVSATGAAVPASATYLGGNKSGNITGLALDGSGNLNVNIQAGTVTATNPSVGTDGSAIPTSSTLIGASDGTNLQQLLVESSSNRNLRTGIYSGANEATVTGSNALKVDNSAVTQPISAASLPLPTGASTVAKQPALGTAGTASADVITVQGIASMTALKTDGSGVTQPVSGTVTVQQATAANLKVDLSGTAANATAIKVDNSGVTQPVSGTITSNIGTTNGLALDASVNGVIVTQGSATSGEKGPLVQGAVTTGSPTYTTAQTSPISLTTAGAVRVDASATTQPVSGTVTANQGGTWTVQPGNTANTTAWKVDGSAVIQPVSGTVTANAGSGNFTVVQATASNLNAQVVGAAASGASNTGNPVKAGGAFNSTQPTVTTGQAVDAQYTARGAAIVATGVDAFAVNATQAGTWNVTNVSGTVSLPTGASTSAKQPALGTAGSAASDVLTVQGIASMTALKVDGSAVIQPVSGTVAANAGTNLNTSLLALESGGNLASIKTSASAFVDTSTSGSVTNDGDVVSIALPGGQATALMQITTSNLNGTLLFEGSPDSGTTYYSTFANQIGTSTIASSVAGTGGSQAAGAWRANVAGFTNFRVRLHPTTSGTATIKIILTQGVHNVAINNATTLGQATMANSAPVVPASDYVSPVKSSRLEIAGQGTSIVNGSSTDLIPSTDVTGYTMAVLQITGTWSMTLQAQQCNDNANFLQIECINAQTLISTNNLRSTLTANGMFIIPLSGRYLRIRATAWVSNASCVGTLELYTTPPPFVQVAMATYLALGPQGSGGTTDFHLISAANTNGNNIKSSAGQIYGYDFGNSGASDAWAKFYNKATTPTVGTDAVFRTVYIPKGGRASYYSATGIALATGIGIGVTGGAADNDTTAVAASQVTCEVDWS